MQPHPTQQLDHLGPIGRLVTPLDPEWQGHIFVGRQMVEKAKILKNDANSASQRGDLVLVQRCGVLAEEPDEAARRLQRQEEQAQERRSHISLFFR